MTEVAKHLHGTDTVIRGVLRELFVINLCASMTPMPEVPKGIKGFEKYKLYQICKVEDGRRRYRLRMGFFPTETDAQLLVASLRSMYPAALAGCAIEEDLRHAGELPAATSATGIVKAVSIPEPAKPAVPAQRANPVATATKSNPHAAPPPAPPVALALDTREISPVIPSSESSPSGIYHVGRGVTFPETSLELSADELSQTQIQRPGNKPTPQVLPEKTTARPSTHGSAKPTPVASKPAVPTQPAPVPTPSVRPAQSVAKSPATVTKPTAQPIVSATIQAPKTAPNDYVPILDTTLTIRTLTKSEAEDPNRPKWFAVQLAVSEEPINIATMPKLDIFSAYSLYSVALMEGGGIRHTLRLGFFKEKVSAEAVLGYLKTFFNEPTIAQISSAEHDRFSSAKPVKPQPTVSQIDERRPAANGAATKTAAPLQGTATPTRNRVPAKPVASPIAAKANSGKQQSFLSRLIGKQLD